MPGLPHNRPGTGFRERGGQQRRALDVKDHRHSVTEAADCIAAEDDQQLITEDRGGLLVDGSDPVAVAVEGNPQLGSVLTHRLLQVDQILQYGGVRMVVREGAVTLREERHHLRPERLQSADRDQ